MRIRLVMLTMLVAAAVTATSAVAAPCVPALAASSEHFSEGPTSPEDASITIRAAGVLRAKVLFADFADAPGPSDPSLLVAGWMTDGVKWLATSSYAQVRIELDPERRWLRMPRPSADYGFADGTTYEEHRAYFADAVAAADATTDFSQTELLYVVAAPNPSMVTSASFHGQPGVFVLDGREVRFGATFGSDWAKYGRTVLPHETGHLFGLPDLYPYTGTQHRFVGTWDLMGNIFQATDLNAWHKLKLGWLLPGQFTCAKATGITTTTLTPLEIKSGRKAVFIRTGPKTALVIENRQRIANDRGICKRGLVVYTVTSARATGTGPITVVGGRLGNGCGYGPKSDAPLAPGQRLVVGRTTIVALPGAGLNRAVRVTRR
jgi:M6 family metalloprotease-like protein